jgi:hypothetical protein
MESRTIDFQIRFEISIAMARVGADDELLSRVPSINAAQLVDELKALGALPMLLGIVGSWGGTLSDDEILKSLRDWNEESYYQVREMVCPHCKTQIVLVPTMETTHTTSKCPTCAKEFLIVNDGPTTAL